MDIPVPIAMAPERYEYNGAQSKNNDKKTWESLEAIDSIEHLVLKYLNVVTSHRNRAKQAF